MAEIQARRPPRGLLLALGITQIIAWGSLYYAFALLIEPLRRASGAAGSTVVVGAFSVALLAAGLASAPAGRWIDRHGGRGLMSLGSLAAGLLLLALSQVRSLLALYLVWAGLGLAMAATLYDPAFAVLTQLYRSEARGAITRLTLFGGFASTVFWPLTQQLVQQLGWQAALWVLAALQLLVCLPVHALMLPAGAAPDRQGTADEAAAPARPPRLLRDGRFWGLALAFTGNALVFSGMAVQLLSLLQAKGLTAGEAAWVGALVGPMQVAGRVIEFLFLGRVRAARVGLLAMSLLPLSLLLLALAPAQAWALGLFALLYGMGNGVITIVRGAVPAELYGRAHYGAVNGALATPVLLAKAAGPLLAAALLQAGGAQAQLLGLAALAAGAALLFGVAVGGRFALTSARSAH